PVAAAPAPVAAPEPEALELDVPEAPAPAPIAAPAAEKAPPAFAPARPAAVFSDEDPSQDELLLGAEAAAPEAAPKPAQPAPRVATGGTLFERMAGLTRGSEKAPGAEEGTQGLDIPRFLNRQNNQ
ncbi:MAG: cell division protein FtsZ, partial [Sphingobium yanoikuyae]